MLRFFLLDETRGNGEPFAEYHIDVSSGDVKTTVLSRNLDVDKRVHFSREARSHVFRAWLERDSYIEFNSLFFLSIGGLIQGSAFPTQVEDGSSLRLDFKFQHKKNLADDFKIPPSLWGDTDILLQWEEDDQHCEVRFPISVSYTWEVQKKFGTKYEKMRTDLAEEGWFSFIYDNLRGVFAQNRISIHFKEGGTVLDRVDSETERTAIRKEWSWLFEKALLPLLKAPQYQIGKASGFVAVSKIAKPSAVVIRRLQLQAQTPRYVWTERKVLSYSVPAHVAIVAFLRRIYLRFDFLVSGISDEVEAFTKQISLEEGQTKPKGRVIRELKTERASVEGSYNEETKFLARMKSDLSWLRTTNVFKEIFRSGRNSIMLSDVPATCFSSSLIYKEIQTNILDFESKFWNWLSPARTDTKKRPEPTPISQSDSNAPSMRQFAFWAVYQHWCYLQFCRALKQAGLQETNRNLHSGKSSWIEFSACDGLCVTLFHEVRGEGREIIKTKRRPFEEPIWGTGWTKGDNYNTPDFVFIFSGLPNKGSFLIVADAKSAEKWVQDEHGEVWKKYATFLRYQKGYNGDEARIIKTLQTWVVYPMADVPGELSIDDKNDCWSLDAGHLVPSLEWQNGTSCDSHDVCLGRLKGRPPESESEKTQAGGSFLSFVTMQLDYYRNYHPVLSE